MMCEFEMLSLSYSLHSNYSCNLCQISLGNGTHVRMVPEVLGTAGVLGTCAVVSKRQGGRYAPAPPGRNRSHCAAAC